jgi:uncharacterized protein (UPF0210 family)
MRRFLFATAICLCPLISFAAETTHPKVRAITAFVCVDRGTYREQVGEVLTFLRNAKSAYEKGGFEVESIRVTTQPFPDYTRGLKHANAVNFLLEFDAFANKERFMLNIGPAVVKASDDLANLKLLGEVLKQTQVINASAIVADKSGVNWEVVRETGRMVK